MQVQLNALGWSVPSAGSAGRGGRGTGGNAGTAALLRLRTLDDLFALQCHGSLLANGRTRLSDVELHDSR
jgi:hypothetical protein